MARLHLQPRRRLLAAASAAAFSSSLSVALPGPAHAAGNLPPELVLAGAPDDYIGYVFIQRYFPETRHNVDGEILKYFRATGEIEVYGYPLTEEYWEPDATGGTTGRMVQYFQRARLEYRAPAQADSVAPPLPDAEDDDGETGEDEGAIVPSNYHWADTPDTGVHRSALGEALLRRQPAVAPAPGGRYFPETGHNVGGAFLQFFVDAGGRDVLGLPLSEEVPQNGHTVQWFQNAR